MTSTPGTGRVTRGHDAPCGRYEVKQGTTHVTLADVTGFTLADYNGKHIVIVDMRCVGKEGLCWRHGVPFSAATHTLDTYCVEQHEQEEAFASSTGRGEELQALVPGLCHVPLPCSHRHERVLRRVSCAP
jgi:hypothetical protein